MPFATTPSGSSATAQTKNESRKADRGVRLYRSLREESRISRVGEAPVRLRQVHSPLNSAPLCTRSSVWRLSLFLHSSPVRSAWVDNRDVTATQQFRTQEKAPLPCWTETRKTRRADRPNIRAASASRHATASNPSWLLLLFILSRLIVMQVQPGTDYCVETDRILVYVNLRC